MIELEYQNIGSPIAKFSVKEISFIIYYNSDIVRGFSKIGDESDIIIGSTYWITISSGLSSFIMVG